MSSFMVSRGVIWVLWRRHENTSYIEAVLLFVAPLPELKFSRELKTRLRKLSVIFGALMRTESYALQEFHLTLFPEVKISLNCLFTIWIVFIFILTVIWIISSLLGHLVIEFEVKWLPKTWRNKTFCWTNVQ